MNPIQWFPGHMAKARRFVEEKINLVDIVFELLDARIPYSSENPMFSEMIHNKPRLILLNKSDLADDNETKKWIQYFKSQGQMAIAVSSTQGNPYSEVIKASKAILKDVFDKERSKGLKSRPIRAMILGIPNVGKSQLINNLAGKTKAKTGDKPGVTKTQVYLKAGTDLELLDNPGILWPKFEDQESAMRLALLGSIKEDIVPIDEVCIYGMKYLMEKHYDAFVSKYKLKNISEDDMINVIDQVGRNRGCLLKGNEIDYERVYRLFLYDFRNMAFGKISLEEAKI